MAKQNTSVIGVIFLLILFFLIEYWQILIGMAIAFVVVVFLLSMFNEEKKSSYIQKKQENQKKSYQSNKNIDLKINNERRL